MVIQYKCPNCGADMAFDSVSGMLACESCGRKDTIDTISKSTVSSHTISQNYFSKYEAKEYSCKNCGANLITDTHTSATTCSFCGAGIVLSDRLEGSLAPTKILPFTISKDQAMDAFRSWCKKGLLTPRGFMTADRIKSITGLYVPFWLYDLDCEGEAEATCTKVRTYEQGDYIYTETKYYQVYRQVELNYKLIPVDASVKMNDELMDKLEPFPYNNLKDFNMPYLAGFIAEKYNHDDKALFPRAKSKVTNYISNYIDSTILGYTTTSYNRKDIYIQKKQAHYVLLPVWMVTYDFKKSQHTFAMNGQTGKIVGKPPLSFGKIVAWFFGVTSTSFLLMEIIGFFSRGGI